MTLVAGLRAAGVDAILRSAGTRPRGAEDLVLQRAAAWGVEPIGDLHLQKHRSWLRDASDVRRLAELLRSEGHDLIHTHLPNDTRIAARACRRLVRAGGRAPPLVRTVYDTEPELFRASQGRLLARRAAAVMVFSSALGTTLERHGVPARRITRVDTCIDLDRFSPTRPLPDLRPELGFAPDDFLAGIVARVQPQRRFDLLLDMAEQVAAQHPGFRLIVIGRGSNLERVARAPAAERGLLDRVVFFPGYFTDDRYVALLRALDLKLFLVPGTDGTARAVREALALGLPVVCTRRGMLPDLVQDGTSGFLCDETPAAFAQAVLRLARDRTLRDQMGAAATAQAQQRFSIAEQVRQVREVYARAMADRE